MIEPSVSVPMARAQRFADTAAAEPELEPDGLRSSAYGLFVCPPRPLQPLDECSPRKFAHSLKLVLPRMIAPAARSFSATIESRGAIEPSSASEPAVVIMRSCVSILSLMSTGIPCKGPRGPLAFRSRSSSRAIATASGFTSSTARSLGSTSSIRRKYFFVSDAALSFPDFIAACRLATVASSHSNGLTRAGIGVVGEGAADSPRADAIASA